MATGSIPENALVRWPVLRSQRTLPHSLRIVVQLFFAAFPLLLQAPHTAQLETHGQ